MANITQKQIREVASLGRGGDTELAYVNPQEAAFLKALGGSGTINPNTGLREYSWLSSLTDYVFGGGLSGDISNIPIVGDIWDPVTDIYDETIGHGGLGGYVLPVGDSGWFDQQEPGTLWDSLGDVWNEVIGNEGLGGWLGDRFGIHGQLWDGGDGVYLGSHPGDDNAWDAAAKGYGPMKESISELETLKQQIMDSFITGTGLFEEGTNLYNQGTDAYHKGRGLLGQVSRDTLAPNMRAYENLLGRSGSKFGVSAGPIDPREASSNTYLNSIFNARNTERARRATELGRQGAEAGRHQAYLDKLWGVLADARNRYNTWYGDILSPEYQKQAPTFEEVTADMDWLTPPTSTEFQPNYPSAVPG